MDSATTAYLVFLAFVIAVGAYFKGRLDEAKNTHRIIDEWKDWIEESDRFWKSLGFDISAAAK